MTVLVDPFHERFLRVGLLPAAQAIPEWVALREDVELDALWDPDALRLLPLVYRTLADAGTEDPNLVRLKGVVRRAWYDNQVLFHRVRTALRALDEHDVPALLLKGTPLALECYPEVGLRPMVDVDLLVQPHDAGRALDALADAGWSPYHPVDNAEARPLGEQMVHQVACTDGNGSHIDLHWRFVPWVARDGSGQDPELWERARPIDIAGERAAAPSREDLLLLVILHAFRAGWATVPRWAADAVFLLRASADEFDWDHFVTRVVDGHLALPARDGLEYVWREFAAPVPTDALVELARAPAGRLERHRHAVASRTMTTTRRPLVGELGDARIGWARWSLNLTPEAAARSFAPFVTRRLGLERLSELPGAIARRGMRNVRAALRGERTEQHSD